MTTVFSFAKAPVGGEPGEGLHSAKQRLRQNQPPPFGEALKL